MSETYKDAVNNKILDKFFAINIWHAANRIVLYLNEFRNVI